MIFLALFLAGPSAMRSDPQDELQGKVVHISGAVNGQGVVLLFKADSYIILDEVDGSKQQKLNLKDQDYQLNILADSREAYMQMLRDGLTPKPVPAGSQSYLSAIAQSARKRRLGAANLTFITGLVASICSIYVLIIGDDFSFFMETGEEKLAAPALACGLIVSGVGILLFSRKSSAERKYDLYLKEKAAAEKSNRLALNIGLVPRGFALGLRYYFQ